MPPPSWPWSLGTGSFLGVALVLAWHVVPRIYRSYRRRVQLSQASLAVVPVVAFALAALTETVGFAAIPGAFGAGLAVREKMGEERLLERISTLAHGLFIPLFFIHLGTALDLARLGGLGLVAPILLLASFEGEFLGSAGGALAARRG